MIKNTIPRALGIAHIERHFSIVTDIAILTDILPNILTGLSGESFIEGHSFGELGT